MSAPTLGRLFPIAIVLATAISLPGAAWAVGSGRGGAFRTAPQHVGQGGYRGVSGLRPGGSRGLPPIAGVIHTGRGAPWVSAYGHTGTEGRGGSAFRSTGEVDGRTSLGSRQGRDPVFERPLRRGAFGGVRRRFVDGGGRRRVGGFLGYGGFGDDGFGIGSYGDGVYGGRGVYGDAGVYEGQGNAGQGNAGQGTYGAGTTATQTVYGTGRGESYRSEVPLAARYAESPLAPSPYAPYSPADRYAYAASEDVGPGPRVISVRRGSRGCDCGPRSRAEPVFYRYGVGTAY